MGLSGLGAHAGPLADRATAMSDHSRAGGALWGATPLGRQRADTPVSVAFVLPLSNRPELEDLVRRVYDPRDPQYRQFIGPEEFARRFGASKSDFDEVRSYAASQGLYSVYEAPARNLLVVSGSSSAVEQAFGVNLYRYQGADGRALYANDRRPQIPEAIAGKIVGVTGLDNLEVHHHYHSIVGPAEADPAPAAGAKAAPMGGSGPSGGLAPADIKKAYSLGSSYTGAGQTAALLELDGYDMNDVTTYAQRFGLGTPNVQNVLVNGFGGKPVTSSGQVETTLDIDLMLAVAPQLKTLYVYEAANNNAGMLAILNQIAADDKASVISSSWGVAEDLMSLMEADGENQAFLQMAAQGQTFCAASGDSGAYGDAPFYSYDPTVVADDPASQPLVLGVGGTVVSTTGGAWSSEKVWTGTFSGAANNAGGSGGGTSAFWAKPSYQAGDPSHGELPMGASPTMRDVPDVSLNAGPGNGYSIYVPSAHIGTGGWFNIGGTSASAPLWAGFLALVNEAAQASGRGPVGFVNPSLYAVARNAPLYAQTMHDITTGNNLVYSAQGGYDDASGLGSFIGDALINALAQPAVAMVPPAPTGLKTVAGNSAVSVTWSAPTGGVLGYNLKRATSSAGPFNTIATNLSSATAKDTTVQNGTTYYYVVSAVGAAGEGPNSAAAAATPKAVTTPPPGAPTGLKAVAGNAQVALVWNKVSGASSYTVKRATSSGGPYTTVRTGVTGTSCTDKTVTNGVTYYYVITAVNAGGEGAPSGEAAARPVLPVPGIPGSVTATAGIKQVALAWSAPTNVAPVTYSVYRSTSSGGPYATVATGLTGKTYTDKGRVTGTRYYYVVCAGNASGDGAYSAETSATAR